jgi:hypothetical protein
MAALSLAAFAALSAPATTRAGSAPVKNEVRLELQITGLQPGDCEVEVKPGHAGCQFSKVVKQIKGSGAGSRSVALVLDPILAQSTNADRDCAFAITIREAGQPARTFRRGLRLATPTANRPLPTQSLTCYISAPSLADREETPPRRR